MLSRRVARGGPAQTLLGRNVQEDRSARIGIINLYRFVLSLLREPKANDRAFFGDSLFSYFQVRVGITEEEARTAALRILAALGGAGLRGAPSKARWIVRDLLAHEGIDTPVVESPAVPGFRLRRLRATLADLRLRRIIARGDPLDIQERMERRERLGFRSFGVASGRDEEGSWILKLDLFRRLGGRFVRTTRPALTLLRLEGARRAHEEEIGVDGNTPAGPAANVVREWMRAEGRDASSVTAARRFLARRSAIRGK